MIGHEATIRRNKILNKVLDERDRQDKKWGIQDHADFRWLGILMEEIGEASTELLEDNRELATAELIQCTAVLLAWLENRATVATAEDSDGSSSID